VWLSAWLPIFLSVAGNLSRAKDVQLQNAPGPIDSKFGGSTTTTSATQPSKQQMGTTRTLVSPRSISVSRPHP
jgi:hypothetical protein